MKQLVLLLLMIGLLLLLMMLQTLLMQVLRSFRFVQRIMLLLNIQRICVLGWMMMTFGCMDVVQI